MPDRAQFLGRSAGFSALVTWSCALLLAGCGGASSSGATGETPTGPTAVSGDASGAARGRPASVTLSVTSGDVAFPPRDESYAFRLDLEQIYRSELGRTATSNYFDIEGDLVWTQEYLRYRVNSCEHVDAVQRVFDQIDRGLIAPICGPPPGGHVAFPPYGETDDFRRQLDAKYRDGLRRSPSPTFVDADGAIVWTQEYLRYRISGCDDATSRAAVHTAIRGGAAPPLCDVRVPERDVLGHWVGMINMPTPRPFTLDITSRRGDSYSGTYFDYVPGAVTLTWDGEDRVQFTVRFADGAMWFDGRFVAPDRVKGLMGSPYLATRHDFDMTRD